MTWRLLILVTFPLWILPAAVFFLAWMAVTGLYCIAWSILAPASVWLRTGVWPADDYDAGKRWDRFMESKHRDKETL